ncbi:MAG: NAD-dependent epimerase/dehydratase family protein [Terriglobales bacterium]
MLARSDRPLIVTSGTAAAVTPGRLTTDEDAANSPIPRVASEQAAASVTGQGVRASVMRLPQVHDPVKQGLITYLIAVAREKRVSAYVGDGLNRWPAVHRLDAAHLYRLALEKGAAGARYNAVAEQGVPLREISEANRPRPEGAGRLRIPCGGRRALWLARVLDRSRRSGFQRAHAGAAGMAPNAGQAHCRSERHEVFRAHCGRRGFARLACSATVRSY